MPQHPEVLWAQRSSESDEKKVGDLIRASVFLGRVLTIFFRDRVSFLQNILYVTVNLPDIKTETFEYNLTPTSLTFKAKAGK